MSPPGNPLISCFPPCSLVALKEQKPADIITLFRAVTGDLGWPYRSTHLLVENKRLGKDRNSRKHVFVVVGSEPLGPAAKGSSGSRCGSAGHTASAGACPPLPSPRGIKAALRHFIVHPGYCTNPGAAQLMAELRAIRGFCKSSEPFHCMPK